MDVMIGKMQWFGPDSDGDPDIVEDVAIRVNVVRQDGNVQIQFPDSKGEATLEFSLSDLLAQVCLSAGESE